MIESIHLFTGAYAVDALDPAEQFEFESHLAECADCQDELLGLTETAARLGAAAAITPPASLKAAVMGQIGNVRQLAPLPQLVDDASAGPAESADVPGSGAASLAPVIPLRPRRAAVLLTVAAAVLGLVAATLGVLLAQTKSQTTELTARSQAVARVISASDARSIGGDIAGGGRGAVVISASQGKAVLLASSLPAPPSGRIYEMWFIDSAGKAVSAGTFAPDAGGSTVQPLAGSPAGSAVVGVTVEPAGGSTQPTTKPILAVPLT